MRNFTLTMDQIKAIFDAGRHRGSDEATAYDWGSNATGKRYDNLVDVMFDIINKDIPNWDDQVRWDDVDNIVNN